MAQFNGLGLHLGNISRLSAAKTRSISPETSLEKKVKEAWPLRAQVKIVLETGLESLSLNSDSAWRNNRVGQYRRPRCYSTDLEVTNWALAT